MEGGGAKNKHPKMIVTVNHIRIFFSGNKKRPVSPKNKSVGRVQALHAIKTIRL